MHLRNGQVGIDAEMQNMDSMAYGELQRLLELKRRAAQNWKNRYDIFKVVMFTPVSGCDVESPSGWLNRKLFGWNFGNNDHSLQAGVEYVVLIRGKIRKRGIAPRQPRNLNFEAGWDGWEMMGSHPQDYERRIERLNEGAINVYFASKDDDSPDSGALPQMVDADDVDKSSDFGAFAQKVDAYEYRGRRLRMAADMKSEDVEQWAGLWMRVDGPEDLVHSFDNMEDRAVKGSRDWTRYEIDLPVFEDSWDIWFGILLGGKGKVWLRDVQIDVME
jgi:hypothetical protein